MKKVYTIEEVFGLPDDAEHSEALQLSGFSLFSPSIQARAGYSLIKSIERKMDLSAITALTRECEHSVQGGIVIPSAQLDFALPSFYQTMMRYTQSICKFKFTDHEVIVDDCAESFSRDQSNEFSHEELERLQVHELIPDDAKGIKTLERLTLNPEFRERMKAYSRELITIALRNIVHDKPTYSDGSTKPLTGSARDQFLYMQWVATNLAQKYQKDMRE